MDLRTRLTDTGYIVVGLGVMGVEQANTARKDLATKTADRVAPVRHRLDARLRETRSSVTDRYDQVRTRFSDVSDDVADRLAQTRETGSSHATAAARDLVHWADDLVEQLRRRIQPVVGRLPEPIQHANSQIEELVDRGRSVLRERVPDEATAPAA